MQSMQNQSKGTPMTSAEFPYQARFADVLGSRMHYVEDGQGDPILFIHGNPTSSYLWRNILPYASPHGRAIAVDLIGMGRSDKPNLDYRFFDHYRYLEAFIEHLNLTNITLVVHDWGGGLGTSYARRHPDNIAGIVFMESVLKPMDLADADPVTRFLFNRMRDPIKGDRMNRQKAFFLKRLMPMMTKARLSPAVKAEYLRPYPTPASRKPVAQWPREIPLSGVPEDMVREIGDNYEWFKTAPIPKLLLHASPGVIFKTLVDEIERDVKHLTSVHIGKGKHYVQEDQPDAIGRAIANWIQPQAAAA
jgi:haloalkane dehalogenase